VMHHPATTCATIAARDLTSCGSSRAWFSLFSSPSVDQTIAELCQLLPSACVRHALRVNEG
jgi:hypothetical protein